MRTTHIALSVFALVGTWPMGWDGSSSNGIPEPPPGDEAPTPPAPENAKLNAEKRSEHFVFRFRRGSFVERIIERIVSDREAAYDKLRDVLNIEVPVTVNIDLHSGLDAEATGNGSSRPPHNTLNDHHIVEVCDALYQCDPSHELTHIFTYHFGGGRGGLYEPFAAYCENDADVAGAIARTRQKLEQGTLAPLGTALSTPVTRRSHSLTTFCG